MTQHAVPDSQLSVVSAYFTAFAYEYLRPTLDVVGKMRFLFGEPRFLRDADSNSLTPPAFSLDEDGLKLSEQIRQRAVAQRCANWIRERVEIRSVKNAGLLHGKLIHVDDGHRGHALVGSSNFTLSGLGLATKPNIELNLVVDGDRDRDDLLAWFNELWADGALTEDVRDEVLLTLEAAYKHASPEFVYFKTLLHLFEQFLADQAIEEDRLKQTSFAETAVWKMLFDFQRDGLRAVLAKIDRHGGCILADSVGLGKTFTALAVIKWFELRNQRVLVLCPKKLRENWTDFLAINNSDLNPLRDDRFNYTVLSHTDLAREHGRVDGVDLAAVNWGNYDLVVIDESHNFRTASRNKGAGPERRSRYQRLMDNVIKAGIPTKVLLLSATPVNNDLSDLKAQLDLIAGDDPHHFSDLGIPNLATLVGAARRKFAEWAKGGGRNATTLLNSLPPAIFGLLDGVTIARSRRHIERHYAASLDRIGPFPERAAPLSLFSGIDNAEVFPSFEAIDGKIGQLELALYNPLEFVRDEHKARYGKGANFDQDTREKYLIGMMKVGFLKRLESSVSSFRQTMERITAKIDQRLCELDNFDAAAPTMIDTPTLDESDGDEEITDAFEVGGALKYNLAHIRRDDWRAALLRDRDRVSGLAAAARAVTPARDAKLDELKRLIREKASTPTINRNGEVNRKLVMFTAFTDTARYLYDELRPLAEELGINAALVTGDGCKSTFGRARFQDVLANFAPRAKRRAAMRSMPQDGEIDLLIATDCISEGQNLQDADLLVNVDIHWNPVRLIQRFGRIDRIGSLNERIQMVNFWPTHDLNRYLRLRDRVEARMALVDMSATGEDNLLDAGDGVDADVRWRDQQLLRLKDEVFDLEDANTGVTLSEFSLEDFRTDLLDFARADEAALRDAPLGLHAIVPAEVEGGRLDPGVIFCLRRRPADENAKDASINPLDPFYLVYVRDDGTVRHGFGHPKSVLDAYRALCLGRKEPFDALCKVFDVETDLGAKLERFDVLVNAAVSSIGSTYATKVLGVLANSRGARVAESGHQARANSDYDLITWLIVRPTGDSA